MLLQERKEEKIFLVVLLTFGILILFLTPPMCTPDENTHFANICAIGYGDIFPEVRDGQIGRVLSQKIVDFISDNISKYSGNLNEKYSFTGQYFDSWLPNPNEEVVFWNMGNLSTINVIGYLIAGIGVFFGRIFCGIIGDDYATPYNLLIFARLFNAIFYMIVGYWAIKIAPLFKRTMLVLLTMPMSIFLGVSISYDAILIPVCALFFANTFKLILKEEQEYISKTDIAITIFCTFFMTGIKAAYAVFLLLLLLIPKKKFGNLRKYIICIIATAVTGSIAYLGYKIVLSVALKGYCLPEDPLITEQKSYFFTHLYTIPQIAFETIRNFKLFYIQGFYGKLGLLDTNFALPIAVAFYFMLGIIVICDVCRVQKKINWKIRGLDIFSVIFSLGGIFLVMYLTWTPLVLEVGGNVVSGVQGRYFIPAFLYMCLPFANGMLLKNKLVSEKAGEATVFCSNVLAINSGILSCLILLLRYWCL